MKNGFAQKLAALVDDAQRDAPKAIYIALYMVNACYVHGKHKLLARHICKFSELEVRESSLIEAPPEPAMRIH